MVTFTTAELVLIRTQMEQHADINEGLPEGVKADSIAYKIRLELKDNPVHRLLVAKRADVVAHRKERGLAIDTDACGEELRQLNQAIGIDWYEDCPSW